MAKSKVDRTPFTSSVDGDEYRRSIRYNVRGFWGEMVTVTWARNLNDLNKWNPPIIRWASGGRVESEADDATAASNMSMAIADAARVATAGVPELSP